MTRTFLRSTAVALAATALVAAAGCGSAGSRPAARQAAATPTTQPVTTAARQFTSQRYRFRVTLAKGWSEQDATTAWDGKKLQGIGSPAFANFTDPTGRALVAAAVPVAKGTRLAAWRVAMVRAAPQFCSESAKAARTTLGGEPALTWTAACSDGYRVHKVAAVHDGRGYMVLLPSPTADDKAGDRRIFESIRRSFRFT